MMKLMFDNEILLLAYSEKYHLLSTKSKRSALYPLYSILESKANDSDR